MILEIIATSKEDVIEINKSNATQIELCSNLEVDGLTPSIETIKQSLLISKKPINVMIRNHSDNFYCNKKQFKLMIKQIKEIKKLNPNGFVFGILKKNLSLDLSKIKRIIKITKPLDLTFHKAFDVIPIDKKIENANTLFKLGISNILTQGGNELILQNIEILLQLKKQFGEKIILGGGINENNIKQFIKLNFRSFHLGRAIRINNDFNYQINYEIINKFI